MSTNAQPRRHPAHGAPENRTIIHVARTPVLDEANGRKFADELEYLAERRGRCKLLLDMGRVEYLTSTTLNALAQVHQRLRQQGGRLMVRQVRPHLFELFQATRLDAVLDVRKL